MFKMNYEDLYTEIRVDCDNIKAVATAGRRYLEFCTSFPDIALDIDGVFRTIENYIAIVSNKLDHLAQLACDNANGKITPEREG